MKPTVRSESFSSRECARVARMALVTIAALLLFVSKDLAVVVPFDPGSVITAAANGAESVYAEDVDGDGDVDILLASFNDDTVAWYENDGGSSQTFTERVITASADGALSVHATDVDGDGDTDVLSASHVDDTVAWYENDGASPPAFTEHVITAAANGAISIHAADVDGDGDVDVLSASFFDDTVAWYENDGASPPAFTEHVITAAADGAERVHGADVDGDGDVDVLSASSLDDTLAWYENDGANPPTFTKRVITTSADGAAAVHAADVDGDGDTDVVLASAEEDTVAWYANDGASPPAFTRCVIATGADSAFSVHTADLDGDGDLDVLSASWEDDTLAWYENDGASPPAFTERVITSLADGVASVHAADVDGDGDADVLSASFFDDTLAWYENRSPHPDLTFRGRRVTAAAAGAWSVHAADVDGDGDVDLLSASRIDRTVAWYENNGGRLPAFTTRVITAAAAGAWSVHAADVDGDGDVDVLSASVGDDTVAWYENDGSRPPGFTERVITTEADGAASVQTADMDGDGDVDVLSASRYDDTVAWYENDGSRPPSFTERVITTGADYAIWVQTADVDGDGDIDVLSASELDDTVAWYESDGASPPSFTRRVITTSADGVRSVHAADLDGDGDVDVLSASWNDDTLAWYESDGASPPSFTERVITTSAAGAVSVHAEDVDGDGDVDVLLASIGDDTVAWYENDGASPPVFAQRVVTMSAAEVASVHAADVNGDGHVDILSASYRDDKIRWHENRPDVAVVLPPDGDPVDCSSPGVRSTRPRIVWNPGPYDRFRVQISWDPTFAKGERITSGKKLLKRESWRPGARAWRRACNSASPYLYIRVFGLDVNIRNKRSPLRKVMSEPAQVEPVY